MAESSAITGQVDFVDDLRDQLQRVLGGEPEPDERHVGLLPRGHRADFPDVDLARDHLMAEPGDDLGEQLEPVPPLVRDQDAQVGGLEQEQEPESRGTSDRPHT